MELGKIAFYLEIILSEALNTCYYSFQNIMVC